MSAKLRFRGAVSCLLSAFALTACSAEPLSQETTARLERVFAGLPEAQADGVIQNLRMANLYRGELSRDWSPELANAINEAHYDLDFVDERHDLATDGGAAGFLQDLSSAAIRPRLVSEVDEGPADFVQTVKPGAAAIRTGRKCSISGGSYSRNGEMLHLIFYAMAGQAGVEIAWDGWPEPTFPRLLPVRFGDQTLPMMTQYESADSIVRANIFNVNGSWVIEGLKRATEIEIGPEADIAPLVLPTGDLYAAGLAIDVCWKQR
jgi:hypothetical protein